MKKAVIFDLDGTLADTLESLSFCTNRALSDCGFPSLPKDSFKRFVGNGAEMQIRRALRMAGDEETGLPAEGAPADEDGYTTSPLHLKEALTRYLLYFEKDCMYEVRPYAGIRDLLEKLKNINVKIAVFSNKPHQNTQSVIDTLFGKGYFNLIQGQTPNIRKKPAPDGLYEVLAKLGLDKADVLYAGDSCVDMDTGKAAGVQTIGVLWGFRDREELLAHKADALIEKPMELLSFL